MMDTGRNLMSLGFRRNKPISLTTLVKANIKVNCPQKAHCRLESSQPSVARQHEYRRKGSEMKAMEVKVAI